MVTINADAGLLVDAIVWSAASPDREFRDKTWTSSSLGKSGIDSFTFETPVPASGFHAFYIDLKYKAPFGGEYTQSTRMFLISSAGLLTAGK